MTNRIEVQCQYYHWEFKCPKVWEALQETADPKTRFCDECRQNVYLCDDDDCDEHVRLDRCIALEITPVDPNAPRVRTLGVMAPRIHAMDVEIARRTIVGINKRIEAQGDTRPDLERLLRMYRFTGDVEQVAAVEAHLAAL